MVAKKAPVRRTPGPANQSRGAGAAAQPSAAARPPMEGAFYETPGDMEDEPAPQLRATLETQFTDRVRSGSSPLERGGTVDREVLEHLASDTINDPNDLEAEIERIRKIRKPLGAYSQKLALPKRAGYHRHWFNDVAGRVEEAEANGWANVRDKDNKPIVRCVGSGRDKGALYAYAMEIPEVFWQEDLDARNQAATDKMTALKSAPFQAKAGMAKASDQDKFYSPSEALTIEKR